MLWNLFKSSIIYPPTHKKYTSHFCFEVSDLVWITSSRYLLAIGWTTSNLPRHSALENAKEGSLPWTSSSKTFRISWNGWALWKEIDYWRGYCVAVCFLQVKSSGVRQRGNMQDAWADSRSDYVFVGKFVIDSHFFRGWLAIYIYLVEKWYVVHGT